jgi:hypothetical protein
MPLKFPLYLELVIKNNDGWIIFSESYFITEYLHLSKKITDCYFVYKLNECNYEFNVIVKSKANRLISKIDEDF